MGIFTGLFKSRDKPQNSYDSPSYTYFFGRANSGKRVTDRTALQHIAVYACVRVLSEAIAQLPLHVYKYNDKGKERVPQHPLYFLLHDQPNPEMTSFVFRETLMSHLLIYTQHDDITKTMQAYIRRNATKTQKQDEYNEQYEKYEQKSYEIKKDISAVQAKIARRLSRKELLDAMMRELETADLTLPEFDEKLWRIMVENVTVGLDGEMLFKFRNGIEVTVK